MAQDATLILPGHDPASIHRAAELLRKGALVGMPTETVYGLAADALNETAVANVFEVKQRPSFDPLIVHVPTIARAAQLAGLNDQAQRLAQAFWPGPMTMVLPRRVDIQGKPIVPDLVTAGLDTVGLRVPDHPVALALLSESQCPLAAPSANRFGSISPTTAQHVADELNGRVSVVLDGGPCARGVESTVVRVTDARVEVLRLGALPVEQIEEVLGQGIALREPSSSPGHDALNPSQPSPGLSQRHYAPGTPMCLLQNTDALNGLQVSGRWALVCVGALPEGVDRFAVLRNLSESGDLAFAAAGLFSTLRELDAMGLDGIAALAVADEGIGKAINDRLRRGSAR